jgi:hypothetical protein
MQWKLRAVLMFAMLVLATTTGMAPSRDQNTVAGITAAAGLSVSPSIMAISSESVAAAAADLTLPRATLLDEEPYEEEGCEEFCPPPEEPEWPCHIGGCYFIPPAPPHCQYCMAPWHGGNHKRCIWCEF